MLGLGLANHTSEGSKSYMYNLFTKFFNKPLETGLLQEAFSGFASSSPLHQDIWEMKGQKQRKSENEAKLCQKPLP